LSASGLGYLRTSKLDLRIEISSRVRQFRKIKTSTSAVEKRKWIRKQATKYRQLAETAEDAFVKQEFFELAAVWRMKSTTAEQADN